MEVMGLMLGEFVDEYTVRVVDVFAMPQSGTGVSVEAVDHVFQTNMLDMLKQTGRCFEALNPRAIAVVVDPIQSVKVGLLVTLNLPLDVIYQALIHGLNRHYYSIAINYRKNELEEKMLLNLHKKKWTDGLILRPFDTHSKTNEQTVQRAIRMVPPRMSMCPSNWRGRASTLDVDVAVGLAWAWVSKASPLFTLSFSRAPPPPKRVLSEALYGRREDLECWLSWVPTPWTRVAT
ncbi:hypothetical protein B296_00015427 [Ensete ventricosum]|uniref:JAB1/MPN/MOV34 metalloenzyme domain-containing protein n=1 Tax=Ensete ventricosum TaxID=4639 RepID=A0A427B691_ENSVE|nr:hypothetical protein B296_00015427 [Ensete ventricosum]